MQRQILLDLLRCMGVDVQKQMRLGSATHIVAQDVDDRVSNKLQHVRKYATALCCISSALMRRWRTLLNDSGKSAGRSGLPRSASSTASGSTTVSVNGKYYLQVAFAGKALCPLLELLSQAVMVRHQQSNWNFHLETFHPLGLLSQYAAQHLPLRVLLARLTCAPRPLC